MKTPAEIQKAYETLKADNESIEYDNGSTHESGMMWGLEEALAWVLGHPSDWEESLDSSAKGIRHYDD